MHVLWWNAKHATLLNHLRVLPHDCFDDDQILHGDTRVNSLGLLPSEDGLHVDVDQDIVHFVAFGAGDNIGNAWDLDILRFNPGFQKFLLGLQKRDRVEDETALLLQHDIDCDCNLAL